VVERVEGRNNEGWWVMSNGKMGLITTHESTKTAYECDDGVRY